MNSYKNGFEFQGVLISLESCSEQLALRAEDLCATDRAISHTLASSQYDPMRDSAYRSAFACYCEAYSSYKSIMANAIEASPSTATTNELSNLDGYLSLVEKANRFNCEQLLNHAAHAWESTQDTLHNIRRLLNIQSG